MEIKPNWVRWGIMAGVIMFGIFCVIYLTWDVWSQLEMYRKVIVVVLLLSFIFFIIDDFIVTCKNIKMSEGGFTIKILNYKRSYKWEDFAVKRKEGKDWFVMPSKYVSSYVPHKGVIFSLRPMDKLNKRDPYTYCLMHPFSCFVIYLLEDIEVYNRGNSPRVFCEVNESEFMQNMEKWGVELEEDL